MEEQRLKPMVANYDPVLFEELYQKTDALRRSLARGIDHRRFGVDNEEILSWFTVKFIYAYNKYVHKYDRDVLLGHMIRAMQFMKCRIIKAAYTVKNSQSFVEYTGNEIQPIDDPREDREYLYEKCMRFMRTNLSDNAYMLLQLQINPPPYILRRLTEKSGSIHKIPDELIAEYFDLGFSNEAIRYVGSLKNEIKQVTLIAKGYFRQSEQPKMLHHKVA